MMAASSVYKHLRLITFDATNTLITVARDTGAQYAEVAALYGVRGATEVRDDPAKVAQLSAAFRPAFNRLDAEQPNYGLQNGSNPVQWWSSLVARTFEDVGFDFSSEEEAKKIRATAAHLWKVYSRGSAWKLKDGAKDLLTDLRAARPSVELAVLSNSDDRLEVILAELGISHLFQYRFISAQMGAEKPSPEIFAAVFSRAHISRPRTEYLHVGDSLEKDYRPALAAGGNAILVSKKLLKQLKVEEAGIDSEHVVGELTELRKLLLPPA